MAVIAAVAAVGITGVAAAVGIGGGGGELPRRENGPPETAEVVRETLVDFEDVDGEVGYGEAVPLRYLPPVDPAAPCAGRPAGAPAASSPAVTAVKAEPTASPPPAGTSPPPAAPPPTGAPPTGSTPSTPPPAPPPPAATSPPPAASPPPGGEGSCPPPEEGLGLVTWLPAERATVRRGEPLLRVDNRPVVLLYGRLPHYRTLRTGSTGPDVAQLEKNLSALGYTGVVADERYTPATAALVRRWQRDLGLVETGTVAPGQVVYERGAVRVATRTLRVGDPASGEVLRYTGTARAVTATLSGGDRRFAEPEAEVSVLLPGGGEAAGTVAAVEAVPPVEDPAGRPAGAAEESVLVAVELADRAALAELPEGPVTVRFVADRREDVLTVPVTALVALAGTGEAGGGYGVEVVAAGGSTHYVAVDTGLFARGRVEITAGDLAEGTTVVVAA